MQVRVAGVWREGEIVDRESVRGHTQVRVAGRGFDVWVDETAIMRTAAQPFPDETVDHVDEGNSTTLPYNPEPQVTADLFSDTPNIQPGEYDIDPDERLHASDSLTFEDRPERAQPAPDADLFARSASRRHANPALAVPIARAVAPAVAGELLGGEEEQPQDAEDGGLVQKGIDESPLGILLGSADVNLGPKYASWILDAQKVDHYNDPIQRFRDDPIREMHRQAAIHLSDHDPATEQYGFMVEADRDLREAAWADVRDKAKRLRSEGAVQVLDVGPDRIYATVKGDNGAYDVMVKKGSEFGGFGRGQSVADYTCSCEWGRWAFKRQYRHVGRMCSHALAAYHEMQSQYLKDNPEHFQRAAAVHTSGVVEDYKKWCESVGAGVDHDSATDFIELHDAEFTDTDVEKLYDWVADNPNRRETRDFDDPYGDLADILYSGPQRLSPDLVLPAESEGDESSTFVDVEKDDREHTAPDQIVHFSHLLYADIDTGGSGIPTPEGMSDAMGSSGTPIGSPGSSTSFSIGDAASGGLPGGIVPRPANPQPGDSFSGDGWSVNSDGSFNPGSVTPTDAPGTVNAENAGIPWEETGTADVTPLADRSTATPAAADYTSAPDAAGTGADSAGGDWTANDIGAGSIGAGDYTIQSGDTLSEIAEGSGYSVDELASANGIANPDMIMAGDTLTIPGQSADGGAGAEHGLSGGAAPGPEADAAAPAADAPVTSGGVAGTGIDPIAPVPELNSPENTDMGLTPSVPLPGEKTGGFRFLYADITDDPAEPGVAGNNGSTSSAPSDDDEAATAAGSSAPTAETGGFEFDPSMIMDIATPVIQGVTTVAQPLVQGVGQAVGQGLSNMFLSGAVGSDTPAHWHTTSQQYVEENERPNHVDVTDLGDGDMIKYTKDADKPQQRAAGVRTIGRQVARVQPKVVKADPNFRPTENFGYDGTTKVAAPVGSANEREDDLVRQFQASAAASDLLHGGPSAPRTSSAGGGGSFSDDDIAGRAAAALQRTAGRKFTLAQQRELEDESHPLGARNLPTEEDLAGTHYVS